MLRAGPSSVTRGCSPHASEGLKDDRHPLVIAVAPPCWNPAVAAHLGGKTSPPPSVWLGPAQSLGREGVGPVAGPEATCLASRMLLCE